MAAGRRAADSTSRGSAAWRKVPISWTIPSKSVKLARMGRKPFQVGAVAVVLAAFAIGCNRLAEWSARLHDMTATILCELALGVALYALAWWLMMWTRKIWRDVTAPRDEARR